MDQELWVIKGRQPVAWSIPFVVQWVGQETAEMLHAIPLMAPQRVAVEMRLQLCAERQGDHWHITRESLENIGERTKGGDPDLYFSWAAPRLADKPEFHPERRADRDEFLDALFAAGVGDSRVELEYYWNQFAKHSLDWLLNKQKPVDFYFIRLHPTPYRANWMHVLCSRFPKIWRAAGKKSENAREMILLNAGFMDELLSLDLLAINPQDGYCYRRVEVELKPAWWKAVREVEVARLAAKHVYGYARSVMDSVKRGLPAALRVYGLYLAQIARPSVTHREGERYGDYRFLPHIPKSHLRPAPVMPAAVPPVVPNKPPAFTPAREPEAVPGAHGGVPALPPVQPASQDLRDPGEDLPQPRDAATGAGGVPVLPSDEELAARQLLELRSHGRLPRVAGGTE